MSNPCEDERGQNHQSSKQNITSISILYLDDEPGLLQAVRLSLEDTGCCTIDTAESADEALEKLHNQKYDAIISDYDMPDIDGLGFLQQVRERYGDIPFILYTGVSREELLLKAINTGVNFYLQKGGDPEPQFAELIHTIRQAVLRRRSEQALAECENKYRILFEDAILGIYRTTPDGKYLDLNPTFARMYGYSSPAEMRKEVFDIQKQLYVNPEDRQILRKRLEQEGVVRDFEAEFFHRNGYRIWVRIHARVVQDPDGRIMYYEGTCEDITTRRIAEEQLKNRNEDLIAANKALTALLERITTAEDELAARNQDLIEQQHRLNQSHRALQGANRQLNLLSSITRHDILNKITVLNEYVTLLKDESEDPIVKKYINVIESVTNTIREQIAFTRIYQNLGTHEPQWIPVRALISSLNAPGMIQLDQSINRIVIYTDPICGKIFENLLDNSIRHGQRVSKIQVTSRTTAEGLVIIWEDDGVGVAESEKEHIFERGYGKNTGFGLFLVREILSITGIGIHENGIEGRGARFEILVPNEGFKITD